MYYLRRNVLICTLCAAVVLAAPLAYAAVAITMTLPKAAGSVSPPWQQGANNVSLENAGGDALVKAVYDTKVDDGSTTLTHIHHRQTPLWIMQGKADAGITWRSEALFQEQAGHPVAHVDIPAANNTTAIYAGALATGASHARASRRWLNFIRSPEALSIFERYGFTPYQPDVATSAR